MIGTYGPVTFIASDDLLRTFNNMQRQRSGRYARHDVIGAKPLLEYTGADLDTVNFDMRFDAFKGVNPREELDALNRIIGQTHALVLAGRPMGNFVIETVSEDIRRVDNGGRVLIATASVQMLEDGGL